MFSFISTIAFSHRENEVGRNHRAEIRMKLGDMEADSFYEGFLMLGGDHRSAFTSDD